MSKEIILAKGKVFLETEGFEGSLTGVYLEVRKGNPIPLNDFLIENDTIDLEGKTITIKAVIEDDK